LPWLGFGALLAWLWTKRSSWGGTPCSPRLFLHQLAPFSASTHFLHELFMGDGFTSSTFLPLHHRLIARPSAISMIASLPPARPRAPLDHADHRPAGLSRALVRRGVYTTTRFDLRHRAQTPAPGWRKQHGQACAQRGDPGKAVNYFATAVAEKPDSPNCTEIRNALAQSGRVADAWRRWTRAAARSE